jgi:hypothetical protein
MTSTAAALAVVSADIREWRGKTLVKLKSVAAFASALEEEAARQRDAENRWLSSREFARWWPVAGARALSAVVADTDSRGFVDGDTAVRALRTAAIDIFAAPSMHSSVAAARLEAWIFGGCDGAAAADAAAAVMGKVQAGSDEVSVDDLRHESVVAIFGTNALRMHIPTFPFVYCLARVAGTTSRRSQVSRSAAASPRRRRATSVQRAEPQQQQPGAAAPPPSLHLMVLENVLTPGSLVLEDAIEARMTASDFYLVLMQVTYALKFASDQVGFTHYDLHPRNVILRSIGGLLRPEDTAYIPFERGEIFVAARYVAAVVETGFSHVTAKNDRGRNVAFGFAARGRAELVELGIFRDRANPMTDIYRLLLTCADVAQECGNAAVVSAVADLFAYFNAAEKLADVIERQRENWFYLPLTTRTRAFNFDDFIAHARRAAREPRNKWASSRAITAALPQGALLVRSGDGFVEDAKCALFSASRTVVSAANAAGAPAAAPAAAPRDARCVHVVPASVLGFTDVYTAVMSRLRAARDYTTRRQVTQEFISGFTRDASRFNAAGKAAVEHARRSLAAAERIVDTGLVLDFAAAESVAAAQRIMVLFCAIREIHVALRFVVKMYWQKSAEGAPPAVDAMLADVFSVLDNLAVTAAAICSGVQAAGDGAAPPQLSALCAEAAAEIKEEDDSDGGSDSGGDSGGVGSADSAAAPQ